jgi:hypothetical protein
MMTVHCLHIFDFFSKCKIRPSLIMFAVTLPTHSKHRYSNFFMATLRLDFFFFFLDFEFKNSACLLKTLIQQLICLKHVLDSINSFEI